MSSSRDSHIIELWLGRQGSPHTRGRYRRDAPRLLDHVPKPLSRLTLGDLQSFAQSLVQDGLAPISRARTLAAVKSLFGFCQRMRYIPATPPPSFRCPAMRSGWPSGSSARTTFAGWWKRTQNRAIGCCYGCFMPQDCEFQRLAGCFGAMYGPEGIPAKLLCSERTAARGPSP